MDDPTCDLDKLQKWMYIGFWPVFIIYSCYWGGFFFASLNNESMSWVCYATSTYFAFLIVLYLVLGCNLKKAIMSYLNHKMSNPKAPGTSKLQTIIVINCIAMTLRFVFVSLMDWQKAAVDGQVSEQIKA